MRTRLAAALPLAVVLCMVSPARAEDPATGFTIQIRMPVTTLSSVASTAMGNPQFLVGRRGEHGGFGLGFGLSRFAFSSEFSSGGFSGESRSSGILYQVSPAAWFDFWRSPEGNTVGNILIMAGYGRASSHTESSSSGPGFSTKDDDDASGNVIGFGVGVGGDHFLSRNFSIGVESGLQGAVISGFEADSDPDFQQGVSTALFYASLRASIIY